jgi:hypothetical protein
MLVRLYFQQLQVCLVTGYPYDYLPGLVSSSSMWPHCVHSYRTLTGKISGVGSDGFCCDCGT